MCFICYVRACHCVRVGVIGHGFLLGVIFLECYWSWGYQPGVFFLGVPGRGIIGQRLLSEGYWPGILSEGYWPRDFTLEPTESWKSQQKAGRVNSSETCTNMKPNQRMKSCSKSHDALRCVDSHYRP